MTVAQSDVIRATAKMSIGVEDIQNVYHFIVGGSGTPSDSDAMDAIVDCLDDAYAELELKISDEVTFDSIDFYNLTQETYMGSKNWTTLTVGGEPGDMMPPQVCPFVLFDTDVLRSQGRKFLPPTTEGYNDPGGGPTAGLLTVLALYVAEIMLGGVDGTTTFLPGNYRELTSTFIQWVLGRAPDFFATQRRRYFGSGS